jgi:hypothetical protein
MEAHEKQHELVILHENSKAPVFNNWQDRSPKASEVEWNIRQLNRNWGIKLRGLVVADKDARSRKAYDWMRLRRIHRSSMEVETRKGVHFFFGLPEATEEVRTRIKFLGLPLDLLTGGNRFVVGAGSEVDGFTYSLRDGCEIKAPDDLPLFPVDVFQRNTNTTIETVCQLPDERAKRYVDKIAPSVQGSNGSRALIVACLKILSLTEGDMQRAWELVCYYNAVKCTPPWDQEAENGPDSLKRKLMEARRFWRPKGG